MWTKEITSLNLSSSDMVDDSLKMIHMASYLDTIYINDNPNLTIECFSHLAKCKRLRNIVMDDMGNGMISKFQLVQQLRHVYLLGVSGSRCRELQRMLPRLSEINISGY